ncbi:MAG: hypothetical protein ABIB93_05480, partial [Chloroflexota bacterium]
CLLHIVHIAHYSSTSPKRSANSRGSKQQIRQAILIFGIFLNLIANISFYVTLRAKPEAIRPAHPDFSVNLSRLPVFPKRGGYVK